jgi:hypothetical protein
MVGEWTEIHTGSDVQPITSASVDRRTSGKKANIEDPVIVDAAVEDDDISILSQPFEDDIIDDEKMLLDIFRTLQIAEKSFSWPVESWV